MAGIKNIAVFASGRGSNFSAIAAAIKNKKVRANLALLVCDNPKAFVLKKAQKAKVKTVLVRRPDFSSKKYFEAEIINRLKENKIDLIVLAGYMRILSAEFVNKYRGRIINIHPSLLPAFKGEHGIKDAFDYGVKVTGVTVHFVDEHMDNGAIMVQQALTIKVKETIAALEARIHKIEHKLYPEAIKLFIEGKLKIKGRKVIRL